MDGSSTARDGSCREAAWFNARMEPRPAAAAARSTAAGNVPRENRRRGPRFIRRPFPRHDVAFLKLSSVEERRGALRWGPPVPPGEPTGLNKERPGQCTEGVLTAPGSRPRGRRPPGSHNPGDGQVVGTVNTCESAIKTVMRQGAKVAALARGSLQPNRHCGSERGFNGAASWTMHPPVDSRYLPPQVLRTRNVETPYASRRRASAGRWVRREANRSTCGLGMSEEANAAL